MERTGELDGASAESLIGRLHGSDVAPLTSHVARYRGGDTGATLYVSRFATRAIADSVVTRMAGSIGTANRVFGGHRRFRADGVEVHTVLGQGQTHFFFARGTDVLWLGVDAAAARAALAGLLGTVVERLPADPMPGVARARVAHDSADDAAIGILSDGAPLDGSGPPPTSGNGTTLFLGLTASSLLFLVVGAWLVEAVRGLRTARGRRAPVDRHAGGSRC